MTKMMTIKSDKNMKTQDFFATTTCSNTAAARFRTACAAKLLLALPAAVQAQFTYTTNNDGTLNVSGYTGGGAVTISNSVNGLPVTSIGNNAFIDCSGLTSVTIGTNVTSIGDQAFIGIQSLTNVTIPNSVTNLGFGVFWGCNSLTNVTIPNGVTSIGYATFNGCSSLTSIIIPTNVTSIGSYAFAGCGSLTSIIIPINVTDIGSHVFESCGVLAAITVDPNNPAYSSVAGVLFNKSQTTLIQYPAGKAGTAYAVPTTVTSIGDHAFFICRNLTSVTIPSSVTNIGDYAFAYCTSLTGIYFQGNAPGLGGPSAFLGDTATVYFLPWISGWGGGTFGGLTTAVGSQQLQAGGAGVRTNQFGFTFTGTNSQVIVEACTNLSTPVWSPVGTNTLTGGSSYFSDAAWTNYPDHFYRLHAP